jgi:hypothetical protein
MAKPRQPAKREWMPGDELFFCGQPPFCLGQIDLRNHTAEKVKIKRLPISGLDLQTLRGTELNELRVFARLEPGESQVLPAQLLVHPQTKPGTYSGTVRFGDTERPVIVEVLESWDLAVAPNRVSLKVRNGERLSRTIVIRNVGNMPYTLRRASFLRLFQEGGVHTSIFEALKAGGREGYEKVLDEFMKRMSEKEVEPAKIRISSEHSVIEPGSSVQAELEITLPAELKRNHLYLGHVSFENAELVIDLEVLNGTVAAKGAENDD